MSTDRQLIAMHGWCGDSRSWDPWLPLWRSRGWRCSCGERGYGALAAHQPGWADAPGLKVVIAHSLGPHLLPPAVLQAADALVLLTSFARFVPAGHKGKRVQAALAAMATQLRGENPGAMLQAFLEQVAAPAAPELLQASPAREPLDSRGLERLHSDLTLIAQARGLPDGFPTEARVLLVQAGNDQIVHPLARQELESSLPSADVLTLAGAGHGLIGTATVAMVNGWIDGLSAR
jgi:pimeloyl-[acyl-carrier protein] methyl ester esterase